VVTRPSTGAVLAIVGGRDWTRSQFNRAVSARRQPGSCFKPFVYAAGFEAAQRRTSAGLTPATVLEDRPFEMVSGGRHWRPENYDGQFRGPVTVRQALEESLNVPTVRAAQRVGLDAVIDTARRCGIESPLDPVPALALGAEELTPIELATAYGTLAHGGRRVTPWIVREVRDAAGRVLLESRPEVRQVLHAETAWLVTDVLRGVFSRGTAQTAAALGYHGDAAGKTGTTDDSRDAWFVGYTSELLALVWVGYDDNARTGLTGASGALPIWVDLVRRAGAPGATDANLREPVGLVVRRIDPTTGALATAWCPEVIEERFVPGTEPEHRCPEHSRPLRRWLRRMFGRSEGGVTLLLRTWP
jgi:penicillin-binding protein 1B